MKGLINNQPNGLTGAHQSSGFGNAYLFTGRRLDKETGIYYYRNRYQEPISGRFVSRDPLIMWLSEQDLHNPYHFVDNNAKTNVDPLGLESSGIDEAIWSNLLATSKIDLSAKEPYVRGTADCFAQIRGESAKEFTTIIGTTLIEAPIEVLKTFSAAGTLSKLGKDLLKKAMKKAGDQIKDDLKEEVNKLFQVWECEAKKEKEKSSCCSCVATLCINKGLNKAFIRFQGKVGEVNETKRHTLPCIRPRAYDVTYQVILNGKKADLSNKKIKVTSGRR